MTQVCRWLAAPAGAAVCAVAVGGGPVTQLHDFDTGFENGVPLVIPAIDPASVGWHAPSGHLFIADSEIEEVNAVWNLLHANVFECSLSGGTLYSSHNLTLMGIGEPTGITFNAGDGFFYVSDDDDSRIYRLAYSPGSGFTLNDWVSTVASAGADDPEGISCDPATGRIYVADGGDELILVYQYQGSDFILLDILDLDELNSSSETPDDPEGIAFDDCTGHLFVVSSPDEAIFEYTTAGDFVARWDIGVLSPAPIAPQGLTMAPTSAAGDNAAAMALYIADGGIDNGQSSAERDGHIYEIAGPCDPPDLVDCNGNGVDDAIDIDSGTSADCNGNGIPDECDGGCAPVVPTILLSFNGTSTTIPGVGSVANEDIVARNSAGAWSLYFDGSDVGLANFTIDALAVLPGGDLLLSFTTAGMIGPVNADDSDIMRFHPTSLGANTAGTWTGYFDGSDVGLTQSTENVDGLAIAADGRLVISTTGNPTVPGVIGAGDEDLLAFAPTSLGGITAGTWAIYFDGSDVGLADSDDEDVDAVSIRANGWILLSTNNSFSVSGLAGVDEDVFRFTPSSLGANTTGTYAAFLVGIAAGIPGSADVGSVAELP